MERFCQHGRPKEGRAGTGFCVGLESSLVQRRRGFAVNGPADSVVLGARRKKRYMAGSVLQLTNLYGERSCNDFVTWIDAPVILEVWGRAHLRLSRLRG